MESDVIDVVVPKTGSTAYNVRVAKGEPIATKNVTLASLLITAAALNGENV